MLRTARRARKLNVWLKMMDDGRHWDYRETLDWHGLCYIPAATRTSELIIAGKDE
jgi:hypothetical protein